MDSTSRAQVRLILDDCVVRSKTAAEKRIASIYADGAAGYWLHSGATIKAVVAVTEELAADLLTQCVNGIVPLAREAEAFSLIEEAVNGFERFTTAKIDQAVRTASRGSRLDNVMQAARKLHSEGQETLRRQLEIHRFTFTAPQPAAANAAPEPAATSKNRGGRPFARHWDQMWASVAMMLYEGDLHPTTQADVENAMKEWLSDHGHKSADSSVRSRAQHLWQLWQRSQDAK